MQIGIITQYYHSCNCGGLLQALALCSVLVKKGFIAEQVCYDLNFDFLQEGMQQAQIESSVPVWRKVVMHIRRQDFLKSIRNAAVRYRTDKRQKNNHQIGLDAMMRFHAFGNSIPHSAAVYKWTNIEESLSVYDVFITGSDQVWNWTWKYDDDEQRWSSDVQKKILDDMFLRFVPDLILKIAYAPSISCPNIPAGIQQYYEESISRLDAISIRESSSLELFPPDLRKRITPVLDPTLLMDKDDWCKALNLPARRKRRKPFIFLYLLGPCEEDRIAVRRIADLLGLPVVTRPNIIQLVKSENALDANLADVEDYKMGPKEFVHYIRDAALVLTNSFHASVFSMSFHTPFYVFQRASKVSMKSRMDSLANDYNLGERFLPYDFPDDCVRQYDRIDWQNVDEVLEEKRRQSMAFLEKALNLAASKTERAGC